MKKRTISKSIKNNSWEYWIGNSRGTAKCLCCGISDIRMNQCEYGHILAEKMGGRETIDNLKPICTTCNRSMGTTHMDTFIERHNYKPINYRRMDGLKEEKMVEDSSDIDLMDIENDLIAKPISEEGQYKIRISEYITEAQKIIDIIRKNTTYISQLDLNIYLPSDVRNWTKNNNLLVKIDINSFIKREKERWNPSTKNRIDVASYIQFVKISYLTYKLFIISNLYEDLRKDIKKKYDWGLDLLEFKCNNFVIGEVDYRKSIVLCRDYSLNYLELYSRIIEGL